MSPRRWALRLRAALLRLLRRCRPPLSFRMGAAGVALVLVLAFNALIALQSSENVLGEQQRLRSGLGVQSRVALIESYAKDLENGVRGYFIGGDTALLESYQHSRAALPQQLRLLQAEPGDSAATAEQVQALQQAVGALLDQSQDLVQRRQQMGASASLEALTPLVEGQKAQMDAVRQASAALERSQAEANAARSATYERARSAERIAILVPSFISVLLTAFLSYLVIRDLRQRQALEQQSEALLRQERRARADAEAASQAKDEFVSTVSHELRTPLQAILGWTQFLSRLIRGHDTAPTAQISVRLEAIERNARSLARMIDDLLDVSRAITGKLSLNTRRVDLADIVQASVDVARPAAAAKGVQLQLEMRDAPLLMVGDADRLRQVAINVINNAVKFTPVGGNVMVRAGRAGTRLEVRVEDSGIGIAPELLPRIFERYVQGSVSSARQYGGLGLGLAIVKHLVEMHGGQATVSSAGIGLGAEFTLNFPVQAVEPQQPTQPWPMASAAAPAAAAAMVQESPQPQRLAGLRMLVVDDDPDVRQVLESLLTAEGARVAAVGSAAEALERLRIQRMDVVLSDIGMPETDGYALARSVRALAEGESVTPASVPLIAFTAFSRKEDERRALDSGFNRHVGKPVDVEKLIAVIVASAASVAVES